MFSYYLTWMVADKFIAKSKFTNKVIIDQN